MTTPERREDARWAFWLGFELRRLWVESGRPNDLGAMFRYLGFIADEGERAAVIPDFVVDYENEETP